MCAFYICKTIYIAECPCTCIDLHGSYEIHVHVHCSYAYMYTNTNACKAGHHCHIQCSVHKLIVFILAGAVMPLTGLLLSHALVLLVTTVLHLQC